MEKAKSLVHQFEPSFQIQKAHADKLKREVIKPWLEFLPLVSSDGVYKDTYGFPRTPYSGEKLPFEDHILFEDFKKHLRFQPNPYTLLQRFKDKAKEYLKNKDVSLIKELETLRDKMESILRKHEQLVVFPGTCDYLSES